MLADVTSDAPKAKSLNSLNPKPACVGVNPSWGARSCVFRWRQQQEVGW